MDSGTDLSGILRLEKGGSNGQWNRLSGIMRLEKGGSNGQWNRLEWNIEARKRWVKWTVEQT